MIHGRVYKIYCNQTGECYYGSTEQTLSRRLTKHKQDYKKWKKGNKNYTTSFRIIERGNFTISLMEEGDFENKSYMKARERYYIENLECVNKNVPNRTNKEWREAHREKILEKNKEYYKENQDKIAEYHKKWYEKNKEQIIEQQKEYKQANQEKIKEQRKEYKQANREKIKERNKEKMTCDCGCIVAYCSKARHLKSKKHTECLAIKD